MVNLTKAPWLKSTENNRKHCLGTFTCMKSPVQSVGWFINFCYVLFVWDGVFRAVWVGLAGIVSFAEGRNKEPGQGVWVSWKQLSNLQSLSGFECLKSMQYTLATLHSLGLGQRIPITDRVELCSTLTVAMCCERRQKSGESTKLGLFFIMSSLFCDGNLTAFSFSLFEFVQKLATAKSSSFEFSPQFQTQFWPGIVSGLQQRLKDRCKAEKTKALFSHCIHPKKSWQMAKLGRSKCRSEMFLKFLLPFLGTTQFWSTEKNWLTSM